MIEPSDLSPPAPERTVLTDGRLELRPLRIADVDDHFEAARESIDEVGRWLAWCHPAYSRTESLEWASRQEELWRQGLEFQFSVREAKTDRFVGSCGLNHLNPGHRFANLGYWVRSGAAGSGIASAAGRLVARFGLAELGLQRVEVVVDVENLSSQRVAEKIGATREAVLRGRLRLNGQASDAVMFSLVPEDLLAQAQAP